MRIGIDARLAHLPGVGRYIEQIIVNLAAIDPLNEYVIYHHARHVPGRYRHYYRDTDLAGLVNAPNFEFVDLEFGTHSLQEQWRLPRLLQRQQVDVFHAPFFIVPVVKVCPLVVTIHDLVTRWVPHTFGSIPSRAYARGMTWWALQFSDRIVTVSKFVEQEIVKTVPKCRSRLHVIHNGVGTEFRPVQDAIELQRVKQRYGIKQDYVLFVGTRKPNKNLDLLIEAFSRVSQTSINLQLVVVAKTDSRYSSAANLTKQLGLKNVVFLDYVEEADLPALYSAATMLTLPSLHEGFGFPVVEAMACGTPVIASNVTSLPEVVGHAGILVDPRSVQDLADAILRIFRDPILANELRQKGLKRAAGFSWRLGTIKLHQIYESLKS